MDWTPSVHPFVCPFICWGRYLRNCYSKFSQIMLTLTSNNILMANNILMGRKNLASKISKWPTDDYFQKILFPI